MPRRPLPPTLALMAWALLALSAPPVEARPWIQELRYHQGDDSRWSAATFDDGAWSTAPLRDLPLPEVPGTSQIPPNGAPKGVPKGVPGTSQILWLRAEIELPPTEVYQPLAVVVSALASHELYWDGVFVASGGVVGSALEDEEPGPIQVMHPLPPELATPGTHLVAVRISSWNAGFRPTTWFYALGVVDPAVMATAAAGNALLPLGALGALLLAGLYFLTLFFLDRDQRSSLLLGLLSFTLGGQMLAEIWRTLFGYSYDWHIVRLRWIAILASASGLLLVGFLLRRFRVPRAGGILSVTAGLVLLGMVLPGYDSKTLAAYGVTLTCSAWICFGALRRRLLGARLASGGVVLCLALLVFGPSSFLDLSVYYGFGALLGCLLVTQALQVRQERQAHETARVNTLRLELELLKRYLQPHFLMNTLTALAEVFEQDPDGAGEVLEALAEEIRTLGDVAARRLIPLGRELELCRAHLVVMSMRRDQHLELVVHGVDPHREVPPAIFHTLLENALSHNHYGGAATVTFELQEKLQGEDILYCFLAPLGEPADERALHDLTACGAGLRYVEARLTEAFGHRWTLTSEAHEGFWRTEILIPKAEK